MIKSVEENEKQVLIITSRSILLFKKMRDEAYLLPKSSVMLFKEGIFCKY